MTDMTVIILTKNEEDNIKRCIQSVKKWVKRIIVVDSFSTDRTVEYAEDLCAEVFQHEFIHYGAQFQWALDSCDIKTKWVFRLDADEEVTDETRCEIEDLCKNNENTNINGFIFRLREIFLGREMRHGILSVLEKLCIFKYGYAYMENRYLGEQLILTKGRSMKLKTLSKHYNYKSLAYLISKNNWYTDREVKDYFIQLKNRDQEFTQLDRPTKIRRFLKYNIYYNFPSSIRCHLYFIYGYYFKLGFLDGREGLYWNFFQCYFYRMLVDAKIYEVEHQGKEIGETGALNA